ncbi:thiamine pyrophosphate-dependent enzyme [Haloferax sp. DFSO52]|uniref:thiamine pyrophosphate-dependent enzyme n=1 Tax=Haloferax sp. DFSO52 TaxID=3388505 RepID=UPI003A8869EE
MEPSSSNATPSSTDVVEPTWGSDHVVDLIQAYDFDFVTFNPGASFRGLEESLVNYGQCVPEIIETPNEGISVAIAHGYAKATDEPALVILHDIVGTLQGSMGLFNAYCDRVPVLALAGGGPARKATRRPWIEWIHTALIQGNLVRDYTKFDDEPAHIDGVAESIIRAYRTANTAPKAPTYVTLDFAVQECELPDGVEVPDLSMYDTPSRPAADPAAIDDAAERLVAADDPAILVDRAGTRPAVVEELVQLAETLGAGVYDSRRYRYNFPNTHSLDLSGTERYRSADVLLAVDVWSLDYRTQKVDHVTHETQSLMDNSYDLIDIGLDDYELSSLVPDYCELRETTVSVNADTELALAALRRAVADKLDGDSAAQQRIEDRTAELEALHDEQREEWEAEAAAAWDEDPISVPRLTAELKEVIEDDEWVIVNGTLCGWIHRLLEIDEFDQYIGGHSGGAGVGYGIGAAIGGALAYQDSDRIPINLQADGDLMQYLGGLWTLGHYEIPLLTIVHNNGTLYNSTQHRMRLADHRDRDSSFERALIGTGLKGPTPDYASLAESLGVKGYGPVEDPDELPAVLAAAWEDVQNGTPVLVDVVCQVR